ncbi:sulfotransferase domain-containing protein [Limnospira maxima]|uniref:sulfotransferase domain-containing protein n=1 Tax=Limnospira sp. TaxID=3100384 RepID=UPI001237258F
MGNLYLITKYGSYPNQFYLLRYDLLIANMLEEVEKIFDFCKIPLEEQTINFIQASCQNYQEDPYSVFRYRPIDDSWKKELNPIIVRTILDDLKNTKL